MSKRKMWIPRFGFLWLKDQSEKTLMIYAIDSTIARLHAQKKVNAHSAAVTQKFTEENLNALLTRYENMLTKLMAKRKNA